MLNMCGNAWDRGLGAGKGSSLNSQDIVQMCFAMQS